METARVLAERATRYGCLLLLVLLSALLWAAPHAAAQTYTFSHFGQEDGLFNQDVSVIVQDARGVLWVGTENGLYQADGSHFVAVSAYRNAEYGSVLAMHVDAGGRVWVVGAKRLVFFNQDGSLHVVPGLNLSVLLEGGVSIASLSSLPDTVFLEREGMLQVVRSSDGGTSWNVTPAFTNTALHAHPSLGKLVSLAADEKRQLLWVGCGKALCKLQPMGSDAVDGQMLAAEWDMTRGIPANAWGTLLVSRDGKLWLRGPGAVLRLDPETWKVDRFGTPSKESDPDLRESHLVEDPDGTLLANVPDGLARLVDGHWTVLTSRNGLPSSQIAYMFFDQNGGFWLAPIGQGIWRWLGYRNWEQWTRAEGLSDNVIWSMVRDRADRLWVAATNDLNQIVEETNRAVPAIPKSPLEGSEGVTVDARGHLWVGGERGMLMDFDPVTRHTRTVARDLDYVYGVRADDASKGRPAGQRVWICMREGVGYVSAEDGWKELHRITDKGAPLRNAWGVTQDKQGTLWFSARGGIYRYDGSEWSGIKFPDGAGLIDYPVLQAAPDGTLWLQAALPKPLLHLRIVDNHAVVVGTVSEEIIATDDISSILFDKRGWLWVGTDLGIYVFDGSRWVHCTQEDGLISDDTDTKGIFADRDGSMWFGTAAGLSHLLHPEQLFHVKAPRISVHTVRLNGQELEPDKPRSFRVRRPALSVQLFSTYYERPRAVVFRYRLQGRDNDWQSARSGTLQFTNLAPGDYKLSVQAVDLRVHAYSQPIEYSFTVLPSWYQRDRFKILGGFLIILLIATWSQVRLRRLKESEAQLKKMVDSQTASLLAEKEELERAQSELVETARRDALTGLLNRSAIFDVLAKMRRNALRDGTPLSIIMADLDHFKSINDRFGHTFGDAVLRECAERFRETLRPGDAVGRYGGEELLLGIPGLDPMYALARMEEIRTAIASRPIVHGEHSIHVTCSFGVAWLNAKNSEVESVVHAADEALYVAKQKGRNRVEFTGDAPGMPEASRSASNLL